MHVSLVLLQYGQPMHIIALHHTSKLAVDCSTINQVAAGYYLLLSVTVVVQCIAIQLYIHIAAWSIKLASYLASY